MAHKKAGSPGLPAAPVQGQVVRYLRRGCCPADCIMTAAMLRQTAAADAKVNSGIHMVPFSFCLVPFRRNRRSSRPPTRHHGSRSWNSAENFDSTIIPITFRNVCCSGPHPLRSDALQHDPVFRLLLLTSSDLCATIVQRPPQMILPLPLCRGVSFACKRVRQT